MAADTEWRWADPQGQQRVIRGDELLAALANGIIPPNAPVWRRGFVDWKPAHDVPELATSALAAANGVVPNVPPPPLFVVAAQSAYETAGVVAPPPRDKANEPPPPPRYVPAPVAPPGSAAAVPSPTPASARKPTPRPVTPKPGTAPPLPAVSRPPVPPSGPGPASRAPSVAAPISQKMSGAEALKRAVPSSPKLPAASKAPAVPGAGRPSSPPRGGSVPPSVDTQRDVNASASKPPPKPATKGLSVPTMMGVPRLPPQPVVPTPPMPTAADKRPDPSRATLHFDGSPARPSEAPRVDHAVPIVAPGVGPVEKNAVTRPPPADTGLVRLGTVRDKVDSVEELTDVAVMSDDTDPRLGPPPPPPSSKAPPSRRMSKPPPPGLRAIATGASKPPPPPARSPSKPPPVVAESPPASAPQRGAASGTLVGTPMRLPGASSAPPLPLTSKVSPGPDDAALLNVGPIPSPGPPPADLLALADAPRESFGSVGDGRGDPTMVIERPRPPWLTKVLERFPQLEPLQRGRPIFFLPVVGGLGALVALVAFGMLVRGCVSLVSPRDKQTSRKTLTSESETAPAQASASASGEAAKEPTAAPTPEPPPEAGPRKTCRVEGSVKTLAPKATVSAGVEAVPTPRGIGVGVATGPKEGAVFEIDAQSLAVLATAKARGTDLRRVTPLVVSGKLFAAADRDRAGDALAGGRTIAAANPFTLGVSGGQLAWAPRGGTAVNPLWPVDGDVDALRAVADGASFAVAFRRPGAVVTGVIGPGMKPAGALTTTRGLGPQVGSPTVGMGGGATVVMWADRAAPEQPWTIRMRHATGGAPLREPEAFAPSGGPGAPFIAPSVAPLGGGQFLVVWTEGSGQSHQVRGAVLDAQGKAGPAFALSPEGTNAGQAQVALTPDGARGVVAFLVSGARGFELAAIGVRCGS